jgi:SNF2 family DNA or RNA helicase
MGYAEATIRGDRIAVHTKTTNGFEFEEMLVACKSVSGGRFHRSEHGKYWHYPLSVEACHELRHAFGNRLRVGNDLAAWYREAATVAAAQTDLSAKTDATLTRVPRAFADWLHGYQRAGAVWIAQGYREAGLVADKPGVGKTPETLAALLEAGVQGPVLIVCPRSSVKSVWGMEAKRHLKGVPVYLCRGNRQQRMRVLGRFATHMSRDPNRLRIVVVVAEMLRVILGDPCYTESGNKISGMCSQRIRNLNFQCDLHQIMREKMAASKDEKERKKDLVPVDFSYPQLFETGLLGGGWSWIILDESHKLLGSLTVAKANLMGRALRLLPERSDRRRYALSGTPFGKGGRVQGLFGTLHWLWPDEYTSFWKWADKVLEVEDKKINRFGDTAKKIIGPKGLRKDATAEEEAEAWERFLVTLGPRILRRTKEETVKDLPPKSYYEVICEMTTEQRKQHEELAEYAEITTPGDMIVANGRLALHTRSRQLANGELTYENEKARFTGVSGKIDRLWDNLEARGITDGTPGDKIVVASEFNEFLDVIEARLDADKIAFLRIDGSLSDKRREGIMERWQGNEGHERVMLVQTKAAGLSINLDAADEMHIMDEDTDPGVNEQLEDRIHRASRIHKVRIFYYRTEGTVDLKAAHDAEYRRRVQHAVLDGRRGNKDLKALMLEALEAENEDTV